jgi:tRNA dimethylallyltransferase
MSSGNRIVGVIGPTATGKTALAIELAEEVGGEVINADSRQLYQHMDIGTAKPSAAERERVRHWGVDVVAPDETFSLGRYLQLVKEAFSDCWARDLTPILTGGTGQYIWAVLEGWNVPQVPPNPALRAELKDQLENDGLQVLIDELAAADPDYAQHVDAQNPRRLMRALEVYRLTGKTPSACRTKTPPDAEVTIIGLNCARDELYARIDKRVDEMVTDGLFDEVRDLVEQGFDCGRNAMSGIGYRQVCQHLNDELSYDESIERIKNATHRLARMQHTWFRDDDERIHWLDITSGDLLAQALRIVESTQES